MQKMLVFFMLLGCIARVLAQDCTATNPNATIVLGQTNFTDTTSGPTGQLLKFNNPFDIAFINGTTPLIVVTDFLNNRVLVFNTSAGTTSGASALSSFGVITGGTPNETTMTGPLGITASGSTCWVTDGGNRRVLRYSPCNEFTVSAVSVLGQTDFTTAQFNCSTNAFRNITNFTFCSPQGLYADASGNLWVADSNFHRVNFYDAAAAVANGSSVTYTWGDELQYDQNVLNGLYSPFGVFVDGGSPPTLFVSDNRDQRVLAWIDPLNFTIPPFTTNFADFQIGTYNGSLVGICTNSTFGPADGVNAGVQNVALNPNTNTFFAIDNGNNRIVAINSYGPGTYFNQPTFSYQIGTPDQNLNCTNNFPFATTPVNSHSLNNPQFIKYDPYITQALWATDYANNRVLRYCTNPSLSPSLSITTSISVSGSTSISGSVSASGAPSLSSGASTSISNTGSASGASSISSSLSISLSGVRVNSVPTVTSVAASIPAAGTSQAAGVTSQAAAGSSVVALSSGQVVATSQGPVIFRCHRPCRNACTICTNVLGGTCTFLGNGRYQCVAPKSGFSYRYRVPGRQTCPPTVGKPHLTALCKAAGGTFTCETPRNNKRSSFTIVTCTKSG